MKNYKILLIALLGLAACSEKKKEQPVAQVETPSTTVNPKYLYATTGTCYSGTNTTFTAATSSNLAFRLNLTTGLKDASLADYNSVPANAGDTPVGIAESDSSNVFILVENTAGRRIEKMAKTAGATRSIFSSNTTVLSAVLRSFSKTSDGGLLIAKTAGIEKITSQGVRMGAPYIGTNLGATCGTTNTNINRVTTNPSGKIFFTNALAANNRWGVISPNGYTTTADCLGAVSAPDANAYPVAISYIASHNQVLVAYAGNSIATNLNSIYVYNFNDTTNAISGATKIYDAATYVAAGYLLYGISAMAYNPADNSLYVATAISNATTVVNYNIEKLTYNPDAKSLTRVGSVPFYSYGVDTKCIASLAISE